MMSAMIFLSPECFNEERDRRKKLCFIITSTCLVASYGSVIGVALGGGAMRVGFGIVIGVAAGAGRGAGATRSAGFGIVIGVAAGTAILSSPAGGSGWGLKADAG